MPNANDAPKGVTIGYILDKHNRTFSGAACKAVQEEAGKEDPSFIDGRGMLFLQGPKYADPETLAASLAARPADSLVAVYDQERDAVALCKHGTGPDGIATVIGELHEGARKGLSSWKTLHGAIDWERGQEQA